MQISSSFNSASTNTQHLAPLLNPERQNESVLDTRKTSPATSEPVTPDNVVQLSASQETRTTQHVAATYAEIWKDGQKIADIDIYGGVTAHNGMIAAAMSSAGGGPELAARRASQIALAVGGEIRSAGQVVDRSTMLMRARLQSAYGN